MAFSSHLSPKPNRLLALRGVLGFRGGDGQVIWRLTSLLTATTSPTPILTAPHLWGIGLTFHYLFDIFKVLTVVVSSFYFGASPIRTTSAISRLSFKHNPIETKFYSPLAKDTARLGPSLGYRAFLESSFPSACAKFPENSRSSNPNYAIKLNQSASSNHDLFQSSNSPLLDQLYNHRLRLRSLRPPLKP